MAETKLVVFLKVVLSLGLYWSFDPVYNFLTSILLPDNLKIIASELQILISLAFSIIVLIIGYYKLKKYIREDKKDTKK